MVLNKNLAKIKKLPNKNDLIDSFPFKFILTYGLVIRLLLLQLPL